MARQVTLQPGGKTFEVHEGESILDAALRHGVTLPYGCRTGTCGTCQCQLVTGEVEYPAGPPLALTDTDVTQGKILPCVGFAREDLVLNAQELSNAGDLIIRTLPTRVAKIEKLCHDVVALYLKLPAVERLQFLAGQYVDILLNDGARRSFSIANAPHEDEFLELHIRHVPGGKFTSRVFDALKEKALLRIQGPLGTFYLREHSDHPIILMGGGTGFAPLKGIVSHALEIGVQRQIHLYWGVRSKRDLYMPEVPQAWEKQHSLFRFTPVLSEAHEADQWSGTLGWVHEAVLADYPDLSDYDVYMSGPPPMITAAKPAFRQAGLPEDHMYYDSFDYAAEVQARINSAEQTARKSDELA